MLTLGVLLEGGLELVELGALDVDGCPFRLLFALPTSLFELILEVPEFCKAALEYNPVTGAHS